MPFMNGSISLRKARLYKGLALCLALLLTCPAAFASNVGTDLTLGIISTKTTEIRPLEPLERDIVSLYNMVYEGLVQIDDDYRPQPLLCERWEETGNGNTWTFYLRSNVTFSDGTPLTAADVVATAQFILDQANNEEAVNKGYYGNLRYFVDSIKAENESTVVVKAKRSYYGFLYAMTFPILPASRIQDANPPGTGPYVVSVFEPQDYMWLTANPMWWQDAPQVQEIMATFHTSNKEIIASYEYARVDTVFTRSVAAAQYKSGSNSLRMDFRTPQLETLLMNQSSFPLGEINIRKAIRYAIDIDKIASQVYMGMVSRTDTPMVNGSWLYADIDGVFEYNPDKARALLEQEGWKDLDQDGILDKVVAGETKPKHLVLRLHVYEEADNSVRTETANMIVDMLAQVNIDVNIVPTTFSDVTTRLKAGSYDLALVAYQMDVAPDPGFMLMSSNTGNYCRYKSEDMTKLCNTLRSKVDPNEYAQTMMDIQRKFAEDCPFICMFYRNGAILTRKMYTTVRDVRELELLRGIASFHE